MWQKYNRVLGVVTGLVGLAISVVGATTQRNLTSANTALGGGSGSPVAKSVPGEATSEKVASATTR